MPSPCRKYDSREKGLGDKFIDEVMWNSALWKRIPYCGAAGIRKRISVGAILNIFLLRVIYEVIENQRLVIIAAVLHAAQHDLRWRKRL